MITHFPGMKIKPGFAASPALDLEIMNFIRKKLSPLAMPQEIGDTSTLEDD
jgi:hypothetical protein